MKYLALIMASWIKSNTELWEKTFVTHLTNNGLCSEYIKNSCNLKIRKQNIIKTGQEFE